MACMINGHVVSITNGLPNLAPPAGTDCDCGKTLAAYDNTGKLIWQETPTGRLLGR